MNYNKNNISDTIKIEVEYLQKQAPENSSIFRTISSEEKNLSKEDKTEPSFIGEGYSGAWQIRGYSQSSKVQIYFIKSLGEMLDIWTPYNYPHRKNESLWASVKGIEGKLTTINNNDNSLNGRFLEEKYEIKKDYEWCHVSAKYGSEWSEQFNCYDVGFHYNGSYPQDIPKTREYLSRDISVLLDGKIEHDGKYHKIVDGRVTTSIITPKEGFDLKTFTEVISKDLGQSIKEMFNYGTIKIIE